MVTGFVYGGFSSGSTGSVLSGRVRGSENERFYEHWKRPVSELWRPWSAGEIPVRRRRWQSAASCFSQDANARTFANPGSSARQALRVWTRPKETRRPHTLLQLIQMAPKAAQPKATPSSHSTTTSAFQSLWTAYLDNTSSRLKFIDSFLVFLVLSGVLQFTYCVLVTSFPFNAFLAGYVFMQDIIESTTAYAVPSHAASAAVSDSLC